MNKKVWTHEKYPNRIFTGTYQPAQFQKNSRLLRLTSEDEKPIRKLFASAEVAKEKGWKYT